MEIVTERRVVILHGFFNERVKNMYTMFDDDHIYACRYRSGIHYTNFDKIIFMDEYL